MVKDIELKRGDDETEEDYQFRICSLREEKRLTWEDVAEILNDELDLNYTESKYRKQYGAYMRGYNKSKEEEQEAYSLPVEDDMTFSKEEKEWRERYTLSTGKIGYYRLLRQDSRFARFYGMVAKCLKHMDVPDDLREVSIGAQEANREFIMTLADLHIGACFESVNNKYSVEIARERFEKLLSKTIIFVKEHSIEKLNILSLGDFLQGILRISDLKTNEMAVVDAFVTAMRLISEFLNKLSQYVLIDFYQVCYSNHDQIRPLGTKASELASEDMGKILFAYLNDVLEQNDRIRIIGDIEHNYLEFKIFDFDCIAMHGHQVKTAHDVYKNLANRHHKFYDYIFLGHTHSLKTFVNAEGSTYDAETLVSSSFVGSDPYADSLMVGSKASVLIHEFDETEGRVASYKIILN